MTYAALGRIHAELTHALTHLRDDEEGQGTVEYIALIVLMGGVFALVAKVAKGGDLGIAGAIQSELKQALDGVSAPGK